MVKNCATTMGLITVKLKIPEVIGEKNTLQWREQTVSSDSNKKTYRHAISQNIQKKQLKVLFTL